MSMLAGPKSRLLSPDESGIRAAVRILESGGLVAFPTETVYGLGADARNPEAVRRIYSAKGRPSGNPLILHVADRHAAEALVGFDREAGRLADRFWPGPLTLTLPRRPESGLAPEALAGLETAAVRVPSHPVARSLIRAFGGPIAGPSANLSGRISPTEASHVAEDLGDRLDAVIDGGPCAVGVESAIVGFLPVGPVLLREGGIAREALEEAMERPFAVAYASERPIAPGSFRSHYAPSARLRPDADSPAPGEAWLGFGPEPEGAEHAVAARNLSPKGDVREAAKRLYGLLRELDASLGGRGRIAVRSVPADGLGAAVNDRLRRAAAPRNRDERSWTN